MKREKQTRQKLLALVGALVAALVTAPAQAVKVVPETQPYPPWTIAPYDLSNYDLNLAPGQAFQPHQGRGFVSRQLAVKSAHAQGRGG